MGYASNMTNVLFCLGALEEVLARQNAPIKQCAAVGAARKTFG